MLQRRSTSPARLVTVLVIAALVCAALGFLASRAVTPVYSATARLVVSVDDQGKPFAEQAETAALYAATFAESLGGSVVGEEVASRAPTADAAEDLTSSTTVELVPGTIALDVTARSTDAGGAARIAETWAQVSVEEGPTLTGLDAARLTLVQPASTPSEPVSPRPLVWAAVGGGAGALLAALVLLLGRPPRRSTAAATTAPPATEDDRAGSGGATQPVPEPEASRPGPLSAPRLGVSGRREPVAAAGGSRRTEVTAEIPAEAPPAGAPGPALGPADDPRPVEHVRDRGLSGAQEAPKAHAPARSEARAERPRADRGVSRWRTLLSAYAPWIAGGAFLLGAAAAVAAGSASSLAGSLLARGAVGLVAGVVVGALIVLVALWVLDRVRRLAVLPQDVARASGAETVVQIGEPRRWSPRRADPRFRDLEPYRDLERVLGARQGAAVVTVVGESADARAALRSIDVAVAAAAAGTRTVLVGAGGSERRPSAQEVLDRLPEPGASVADVTRTDRPRLTVLPLRWPRESDAAGRDLLSSRRLPLLLDRLTATAQRVVIASPPLVDAELSLRVAQVADAAVLVVLAGSSTCVQVREAAERLQRAGSPVVAVVLVQRGTRLPRPVSWSQAPREPSRGPAADERPGALGRQVVREDDSTAADSLAAELRATSVGGGRASAPAPRRPGAAVDTYLPAGARPADRARREDDHEAR